MWDLRRLLLVMLMCCVSGVAAHAADVRIGDTGATADPAKFDDNYPDMKEWAKAGVDGGIPARSAGKVVANLKPGDDLQAAIKDASKKGGGVLVLSAGVYPISTRIDMAPNVVLRGEDEDKTVLECAMRASHISDKTYVVRFENVQRAGLEDLTIRHVEVAKIGLGKYAERVAGAKDNPENIADLHVGGVQMERAEDCWLDNVNIIHSGSHPLNLQGKRITVRDSLVDGAFNKGDLGGPAGSGNVYFAVDHGLMYNCTVRNTRHALVVRDTLAGGDCKFNVFLDCNFEGSVNFHGNRKDEGHNLFEGVLVSAPMSHGWPGWSYWRKTDIGPENLAYRSLGWGGVNDKFASADSTKVYTFTGMKDPNVLTALEKPAPKAGTLYAVNATRPTLITSLGQWPATPAEAGKILKQRAIAGAAGDRK